MVQAMRATAVSFDKASEFGSKQYNASNSLHIAKNVVRNRHRSLAFQVPKPNTRNPAAMAKRNTISHIRSPANHPLMSSRKNPAPIAKYHQANSRARSPFPMFMFTLDAFRPLQMPAGLVILWSSFKSAVRLRCLAHGTRC